MAVEDIIFGKNRHMFGGIEPSNMIVFEAVETIVRSGAIRINVQIPTDTVVDGQTLCSIAGATIVRRYDRYPKDEFDGDVIANITDKNPIMIQDLPMSSGETYKTCFYTAFPYSTQGVYNRSLSNRVAVNIPTDIAYFRVTSKYDSETKTPMNRIYGEFEEDGVSTTVGVIIRKDTTCYPATENDGEFVANIKDDTAEKRFVFDDANVEAGVIYYYTAFPYNSDGVCYRDTNNKAEGKARASSSAWLYGYDLDTKDSNPETRVTYPVEVDNMLYVPVSHTGVNNGSTNTYKFSYGDWEDVEFMPKPCMLKTNGTVGEYLDPNDYTKTIDGAASNVANTSYDGNAMMEWGKIFTKRWEDENGIYHFRCSNQQLDDDYDCWCNYDKDNNQIDNFYTAIYISSCVNGTALRSISGQTIRKNYSAESNATLITNNNGSGWFAEPICDRLLIQDLLVLIGKSTDTQTVFGSGTGDTSTKTGLLDTSGLFGIYGSGVKVFGMESWWGKLLRWTYGLKSYDIGDTGETTYIIKITPGSHDGSKGGGYNYTAVATSSTYFISLSDHIRFHSSDENSYIKVMKTMPYGRIPYHKYKDNVILDNQTDGGSSTMYECDMLYTSYNKGSGAPVAYCGGLSDNVSTGAFFTYVVLPNTTTHATACVALAYKENSTAY